LIEVFEIPPESVWECASELIRHPLCPQLDSRIISDFPEIFAEFRGKYFEILWRGSRDGFRAREFHRRCDGHANTLTVILDTEGNVFGGFTPVKWESSEFGKDKADDSLKSFLFTLTNPHNIPARIFALRAEKKHQAIWCWSEGGPRFKDIGINNYCNTHTNSWTSLGFSYTNDTGLDSKIVFTGSENFQVKEIEVFEITGQTALPRKSCSPRPPELRKLKSARTAS
jgi:hypothetical protein